MDLRLRKHRLALRDTGTAYPGQHAGACTRALVAFRCHPPHGVHDAPHQDDAQLITSAVRSHESLPRRQQIVSSTLMPAHRLESTSSEARRDLVEKLHRQRHVVCFNAHLIEHHFPALHLEWRSAAVVVDVHLEQHPDKTGVHQWIGSGVQDLRRHNFSPRESIAAGCGQTCRTLSRRPDTPLSQARVPGLRLSAYDTALRAKPPLSRRFQMRTRHRQTLKSGLNTTSQM